MADNNMKFKLKKYNMGGYLRFDDGGLFNDYNSDPAVQALMQKKAQSDSQANAIATGVQAIPVYGQLIGAGIKVGQAVGKQTTDPYGIYKSKGSSTVDNMFDLGKGLSKTGDLFSKPDWGTAESLATFGLAGTDKSQDALKRAKDLAIKRSQADQFEASQESGARSRAAIGGFQAAPYGKKGMKFKGKTKFSMAAHR